MLGIREGPHGRPWTEAFLRDAVEVCAETLPVWYMSEMSSLFRHGTESMEGRSILVSQAEDWLIVIQHLRNARGALAKWVDSQRESGPSQLARLVTPADRVPSILRFDRLAGLTTSEGARRLAGAAHIVRQDLARASDWPLTSEQRRLLRAVASGAAVADIAEEFGYSRRSMYRRLSSLWRSLGVTGRMEAVRERDLHWRARGTLLEYADAARWAQRIVQLEEVPA